MMSRSRSLDGSAAGPEYAIVLRLAIRYLKPLDARVRVGAPAPSPTDPRLLRGEYPPESWFHATRKRAPGLHGRARDAVPKNGAQVIHGVFVARQIRRPGVQPWGPWPVGFAPRSMAARAVLYIEHAAAILVPCRG